MCRDVSQSPFILDGVRKGRTSVQEEIEKVVLPHMRCNSSKFITAGAGNLLPTCLAYPSLHAELFHVIAYYAILQT